jgi:hypothetical protein
MAPRFSLKGYFKTVFNKALPQLFNTPPAHPGSFGYLFICEVIVGKQQCLRSFAFFCTVFASIDNPAEYFFLNIR